MVFFQTEISVESFEVPTQFRLSFGLSHFGVLLHDENPNSTTTTEPNPTVIGVDFGGVRADLSLRSCVDRNDKEVYEWRWEFSMSDFIVR